METKRELEQALRDLQSKLSAASATEERLYRESREINSRISELSGQFILVGSEQQKEEKAARLKPMEDEYNRLVAESLTYQQAQKDLRPQIDELRRKIQVAPEPLLDYKGTTAEVLTDLKWAINVAEKERYTIQAKLDELASVRHGSSLSDLELARQERQRLAASVALGEASEQSLNEIYGKVKRLEQAMSEEAAAAAIRGDAMQGLTERIPQAKAKVEAAKQAHHAATVDFMRGAFNRAALGYLDSAEKLIADYHHFAAIANKLNNLGENTPVHKINLPWILQTENTENRLIFDKRHTYDSINDRKLIQESFDLVNGLRFFDDSLL